MPLLLLHVHRRLTTPQFSFFASVRDPFRQQGLTGHRPFLSFVFGFSFLGGGEVLKPLESTSVSQTVSDAFQLGQ